MIAGTTCLVGAVLALMLRPCAERTPEVALEAAE